ncbi:TonB-dependent receptor plug domain-containing protein [Draconibacterium sp.]|nr:TonB-dependent receptor plug domain-containing protein [Draconibacterium sp.]
MKTLLLKHAILVFIIIFCTTSFLVAQEKVLHGKVTTFDSIPLIGASVQIKSTEQIVKTDSLGIFTVSCYQKDKLKVTANGFSRQNVKIEEEVKYIFVNLKLKPGRENREMAIGYGHVKEKERLYSISSMNRNEMDFSQYTDIYEIIRGRFPGVEIRNGEIIIRGTSTLLGSDAALLVVDGVIVNQELFSNLSPVEIASINVLKDASASAYGSRGANGVVLVETRSGGGNK